MKRLHIPKIVMGLYQYVQYSKYFPEKFNFVKEEVKQFLEVNDWFITQYEPLIFAGDKISELYLKRLGFNPINVNAYAPPKVRENKAHFMKHFFIITALEQFEEVLWLDWDTILLKPLDDAFWEYCRKFDTPKFLYIPNYWAVVNCGAYYVPKSWLNAMKKSLSFNIYPPNDELLWLKALPSDVLQRHEFWLYDRAINVSSEKNLSDITSQTYIIHLNNKSLLSDIKNIIIKLNMDYLLG